MWWFFIDVHTTVECVLIALFFACCLSIICFKSLGILQSLGYSNRQFLRWAGKKGNLTQSRLSIVFISTALTSAVTSLCFSFTDRWAAVIGLIAYLVFFVAYFIADATHTVKSNASLTPRFKRLYITLLLTFAVIAYLMATLLNFAQSLIGDSLFTQLKYSVLSLLPLCALPIICLANLIAKIWEKPIANSYIKKAKQKLERSKPLIIGVTGSYGKTSVKNVLAAMLSQKYQVVTTPASYNTPQGIAKAVNGQIFGDNCVFIAEMGARKKGDIAELCAICPPDYSLITGVCPQHLESFKTLENVVATKAEIIPVTKHICFIAADAFEKFKDYGGDKIKACKCVSDVIAGQGGTEFTLSLGGESVRVKTKLLGEHSAYNFGLCACLAYELGVSLSEIATAVGDVQYIEHRLQLIQSNGINIIDDGYNSNPVGARAAIDTLKKFGGKKIAVTPGLVELGVLEQESNEQLGANLVGLDYVILVGETLVKAIEKGYKDNGGDMQKICVVSDLNAAQDKLKTLLEKGDAVLFLNDLPSQYL
ncbi:MAG: Mur ligase family protein [Candidatus Coproplasma sp.]